MPWIVGRGSAAAPVGAAACQWLSWLRRASKPRQPLTSCCPYRRSGASATNDPWHPPETSSPCPKLEVLPRKPHPDRRNLSVSTGLFTSSQVSPSRPVTEPPGDPGV